MSDQGKELFTEEWFLSTAVGKPFLPDIGDDAYQFALDLAWAELICYAPRCPDVFPHALAIAISMYLVNSLPAPDGGGGYIPPNPSDKTAMVVEDQAYDLQRKYQIVSVDRETMSKKQSGILEQFKARCKPIVLGAAYTVGGFSGRVIGGCGCGPCDFESFIDRFSADKAKQR